MRDQIVGRLQSLQRSFAAFTAGQKTIAVIGGLALVLGAVMVFRWASTPTYAPLFTNMAPADASAVVDKLTAAGTPYKLSDGGATVMVPQADVYSSRIQLSGEGLPEPGLGRLRDPRQAEPVDLAVPGADHLQAGHRGRAGEDDRGARLRRRRRRARRDAAGGAVLHRQEADHRLGPRADPPRCDARVPAGAGDRAPGRLQRRGPRPQAGHRDRRRRHRALRRR